MTDDLVRRLRGEYRIPIKDGLGPAGGDEPDNANEFVRHFEVPPIHKEAADEIERLMALNNKGALAFEKEQSAWGKAMQDLNVCRLELKEMGKKRRASEDKIDALLSENYRLRADLAAARETLKETRKKICAAFVNRRVDCDVAVFTHSMLLDAVARINAALKTNADE